MPGARLHETSELARLSLRTTESLAYVQELAKGEEEMKARVATQLFEEIIGQD
ncbi:MAG: hypothetical protein GY930_05565 [bacterium]|nr:hypothetical protein [bacterium]